MARYLRWFTLTAASLLTVVLMINVVVDPYGMAGSAVAPRRTALKPFFGDNHVLGKPFAAWHRQPRAVVFGTSRENHGIDPDHPSWPVPPGTRYNLAMDAANMLDIERLLEHVSTVAPIEEAVIALDFLNMFDGSVPGAANFDASLLVSARRPPSAAILNSLRYFASWPMLRDSFKTLANQRPALVDFENNGRRNAVVFAAAAQRFGQHHMFTYSEAKYLSARLRLPPEKRYVKVDPQGRPTIAALARTLDLAAQRNIEVKLFVTPVHARQLEVYRILGLWHELEQWKRDVVAIANGALLRTTSRPYQLWDFADYSALTSESVPDAGDVASRMQWYWESSHYRKALGDRVLERLFAAPNAALPEDFGVLLNQCDIERHLIGIRTRGARYRTSHPRDIQDIARAAADVR